jgi:hypothetical protein
MLESFFTDHETSVNTIMIKRSLLVCGIKQYDVYLGDTKDAMKETNC